MIGQASRLRRTLVFAAMPLVFLPGLAILLAWTTRTSVGTTTTGVIGMVGLIAATLLLLSGFQRSLELTRLIWRLHSRVQALEADLAASKTAHQELAVREASTAALLATAADAIVS